MKTLFKKTVDYINKLSPILKKTGIILLIIGVLILFQSVNRCSRNKIITEKAVIETNFKFLEEKNKVILNDLSDCLKLNDKLVKENEILRKKQENEANNTEIGVNKTAENIEKAKTVNNNESYAYFQQKYQPDFREDFEFPFTGSQVKIIHINDLKLEGQVDEIKGLIKQLEYCNQRLVNMDMQIMAKNKEIDKYNELLSIQKDLFDNKVAENEVLFKELRRKKFWNFVYKSAIIVGGTYIIVDQF